MRKRYSERGFRTAGGRKRKRLPAVLLFFFLLPYLCSVFLSTGQERLVKDKSERVVECRGRAGTWQIPMETYLKGTLAASIPADCEFETIKAQAVILRTLCEHAYGEREKISDTVISASGVGQEYLDEKQLRELWGDQYEENNRNITQAIAETKGMVLTWEGQIMEPAYFWLSAGTTRDGQEVFGEGNYEYLTRVNCERDMEAEEYLQEAEIPLRRFFQELQKAVGKEDADDWEGRLELTRDSSGYVTRVQADDAVISGEAFREWFDLPSSCFEIQERDGKAVIRTKGVGHGLGFDQYAANRLAKEGKDYRELLQVFFQTAEIQKIE